MPAKSRMLILFIRDYSVSNGLGNNPQSSPTICHFFVENDAIYEVNFLCKKKMRPPKVERKIQFARHHTDSFTVEKKNLSALVLRQTKHKLNRLYIHTFVEYN